MSVDRPANPESIQARLCLSIDICLSSRAISRMCSTCTFDRAGFGLDIAEFALPDLLILLAGVLDADRLTLRPLLQLGI